MTTLPPLGGGWSGEEAGAAKDAGELLARSVHDDVRLLGSHGAVRQRGAKPQCIARSSGYSASGRETAKLVMDAKRRPDGSPRADIAFLAALGVLSASMYLPKRRALPFLRGATSK